MATVLCPRGGPAGPVCEPWSLSPCRHHPSSASEGLRYLAALARGLLQTGPSCLLLDTELGQRQEGCDQAEAKPREEMTPCFLPRAMPSPAVSQCPVGVTS